MYELLRSLLFRLPPEIAHDLSLGAIDLASTLNLAGSLGRVPDDPVRLWNLEFPNPVGLAAGLDKSGDHFNALGELGFGFIEIGTVTPKPQPGNRAPRVFRLPEYEAIINRMGFNNRGVDHLVTRVRRRTYEGVLGINIGKNAHTPVEDAVDDYVIGIDRVFPYADYIAINISSPNTAGLRSLQHGDELESLLETMKERQAVLAEEHAREVPLLVKIAPDLEDREIVDIAGIVRRLEIDGVIATNTTVARDAVAGHRYADEAGGLSGAPVRSAATHVIAMLYAELGDATPIIGVGGITDGDSAVEKIEAGAKLVQLYTGFIYHGPALIVEAARAIATARHEKS